MCGGGGGVGRQPAEPSQGWLAVLAHLRPPPHRLQCAAVLQCCRPRAHSRLARRDGRAKILTTPLRPVMHESLGVLRGRVGFLQEASPRWSMALPKAVPPAALLKS